MLTASSFSSLREWSCNHSKAERAFYKDTDTQFSMLSSSEVGLSFKICLTVFKEGLFKEYIFQMKISV